jgi:hypothetical protein
VGHLAGGDHDHHLVEQCDPPRRLAKGDQRLASAHPGEGPQVLVTESLGDFACFGGQRVRPAGVAALEGLKRGGQEQVPARHTVELAVLDEPAASRQPSAGARHLPPEQKRQP